MTDAFEFVKKLAKGAVYKISDPAHLTEENLLTLPWGGDVWGYSFMLPRGCSLDPASMGHKLPGFSVIVEYELEKQALVVVEAPGAGQGITVEPIVTLSEHHDLFIKTYAAYFWAEWPEAVDSLALSMIGSYLDKTLPVSKGVKILKEGKLAGMLSWFPKKDEKDLLMDWIAWIWLSRDLSKDERKAAQHEVCRLIQGFEHDRARCTVRSWNVRSHGLFRKLGFVPVSINILKGSKAGRGVNAA